MTVREQIEALVEGCAPVTNELLIMMLQASLLTLEAVEAKLLGLRDALTGEELYAIDDVRSQLIASFAIAQSVLRNEGEPKIAR